MTTTLRSTFSRIATASWGSPRSSSWAATVESAPASPSSSRRSNSCTRFARSIEALSWGTALLCATPSCSPSPGPPVVPAVDATDDATIDARELDGVCKTTLGAAPDVVVGQGQSDYLPLADLDQVYVEAGPQGGHHIWIALRMKNLLQSGSRTTPPAPSPRTGATNPPYVMHYTFDPAPGRSFQWALPYFPS